MEGILQQIHLALATTISPDEIDDHIRNIYPFITHRKEKVCLSIEGFNEDARELWEIPEVVSLFERLVASGFISLLEISTSCPFLIEQELPGLGAFEVWLASVGLLKTGQTQINARILGEFMENLEKANQQANKIAQSIKCPWCGRKNTVSKKDDDLYFCSYCDKLFDTKEDD